MGQLHLSSSRLKATPPGFTLVEILAAVSVLVVLVVVLSSMASHVGKLWTRIDSQNQRRTVARALLQSMAREIQMIRIPVPANPLASVSGSGNLQLAVNLTKIADKEAIPSDCLNPHAIFFQAPIAVNDSCGAIAEVGYFVRWDTTSKPGVATANLSRFYADPSKSSDFLIYSGSNWFANVLNVAPATAPSWNGWLADNVIALFVRCLNKDGVPITVNANGQAFEAGNPFAFDSSQGYTDPTTLLVHQAPAVPPCIEITIVVVDSNTAQKIKTPFVATVMTPADLNKDKNMSGSVLSFVNQLPPSIRPGVEVFSTTVFLNTDTY